MGVGSSRKKGKKSTGWIRDTALRIYTEDQLREDWLAIEPVDRLRIAASWVPKTIETKGDSGLSVTFVLNGVRDSKTIQGTMVNAALNPPIEDNEGDPE